jgi:hypothetical protein
MVGRQAWVPFTWVYKLGQRNGDVRRTRHTGVGKRVGFKYKNIRYDLGKVLVLVVIKAS